MKTLIALLVVASLAGCYKMKFELTPPVPEQPSALVAGKWHFSIIGIIELGKIDMAAACGGQAPSSVETRVGFLAGLVNMIFSYYIPIFAVHNATVNCPVGGAAAPPAGAPPAAPAEGAPPPAT